MEANLDDKKDTTNAACIIAFKRYFTWAQEESQHEVILLFVQPKVISKKTLVTIVSADYIIRFWVVAQWIYRLVFFER